MSPFHVQISLRLRPDGAVDGASGGGLDSRSRRGYSVAEGTTGSGVLDVGMGTAWPVSISEVVVPSFASLPSYHDPGYRTGCRLTDRLERFGEFYAKLSGILLACSYPLERRETGGNIAACLSLLMEKDCPRYDWAPCASVGVTQADSCASP